MNDAELEVLRILVPVVVACVNKGLNPSEVCGEFRKIAATMTCPAREPSDTQPQSVS